MKRRLTLIGLVGVALVALVAVVLTRPIPSAHARGGGWILNQFPPYLDGYCAFRVDLTILMNKEYSKSETQPDGSVVIHVTGALKVATTNDATGKTVDYNISGPGTTTVYPDGSVFTDGDGATLQFFPPAAQQAYGVPPLFYFSGHFTSLVDANGNVISFTKVGGPISDACAALS